MSAEQCGNVGIADNVTALRAVNPGDLHEIPDGTVGIYTGAQAVAEGEKMVLHQNVRVKVDCDAIAAAPAGFLVKFDMATQLVKASGTNIGYYHVAKALNATKAVVNLNTTVQPATLSPTTTTTGA